MIAESWTWTWTWIASLSGWAYAVLVLAAVLLALVRKREPSQALGWSLAIVFVPFAGLLFFLLFGNRAISRRLARKMRHRAAFAKHGQAGGDDVDWAGHDRWAVLNQMLMGLEQPPPRTGNDCELYSEGEAAFEAMLAAIEAAEHHVHIEFYIFRSDSLGRRFVALLCDKARAGVEVRLIVDGVGSFGSSGLYRQLRAAGGEVASFLPLFHGARFVSPNLRNHRKIVVCDGRVAFFGGLNIGREYLGRRRNRGRDWADLHMRVAGPVVTDLQWIFVEDWDFCTGTSLEDRRYFEAAEAGANDALELQIIDGGPDLRPNPIRQAILGAVSRVQKRLVITTPYLVPDLGIRDLLGIAARSGAKVQVLTQAPPPDSWLAYYCTLYYARELEASGVEVFGYRPGVLHAKAVVVDSEWAMLGTANLDNRSMFLNFEVMATIRGGGLPAEIEAAIESWRAEATPLGAEFIARMSLPRRALVQLSRLLAPLL